MLANTRFFAIKYFFLLRLLVRLSLQSLIYSGAVQVPFSFHHHRLCRLHYFFQSTYEPAAYRIEMEKLIWFDYQLGASGVVVVVVDGFRLRACLRAVWLIFGSAANLLHSSPINWVARAIVVSRDGVLKYFVKLWQDFRALFVLLLNNCSVAGVEPIWVFVKNWPIDFVVVKGSVAFLRPNRIPIVSNEVEIMWVLGVMSWLFDETSIGVNNFNGNGYKGNDNDDD